MDAIAIAKFSLKLKPSHFDVHLVAFVGHTLGRPDPPHTSGARRAPATQKPKGPKAPPANWTSVMPGEVSYSDFLFVCVGVV